MNKKYKLLPLIVAGGLVLNTGTYVIPVKASAAAEDMFVEQGNADIWKYSIVDYETSLSDEPFVVLIGYSGDIHNVSVPKYIEGYPVLSLGPDFLNSFGIYEKINIYLPDTVKHFDKDCLRDKYDVTVYTESGYTYILNNMSTSSGSDIGFEASEVPPNEKKVYIPDTIMGIPVKHIDSKLLRKTDCEEIRLSDNIETFQMNRLSKLRSVNIPKAAKVLDEEAFVGDENLETVIFHDDLKIIPASAFEKTKVDIPYDKLNWIVGYFSRFEGNYVEADYKTGWCYRVYFDEDYNPINAILIYAPDYDNVPPTQFKGIPVTDVELESGYYDAPTVVISEDTREIIQDMAFSYSIKFVKVKSMDITLPESCFRGTPINELEFPGNVTMLEHSLDQNKYIRSLRFKGENTTLDIDKSCVYMLPKLTELVFPEKCKSMTVGDYSFFDLQISELTLPYGLSKVGYNSFSRLSNLKTLTVNDSPVIGKDAFSQLTSLEDLTFTGHPKMDIGAFNRCPKLKNINVDISEPFDTATFNNCPALETINGEKVFNSDGTLVEKYRTFIEKSFNEADQNGFADKYVNYRVKQIVSEKITDDMSDICKVKILHDELCQMTDYDADDIQAARNHTDIGAFINDSTVCDGYARALNLLLHEAGVESCYVANSSHAWVIVKLDGHYFHVDPTWDDGEKTGYDWFLRTDSQIKDDPSHFVWQIEKPSYLHDFQWDFLPECSDMLGDVNESGTIDAKDATAVLTAYAKASLGEELAVDPVLADFNFDGTINAVDASAILTFYAKSSVE